MRTTAAHEIGASDQKVSDYTNFFQREKTVLVPINVPGKLCLRPLLPSFKNNMWEHQLWRKRKSGNRLGRLSKLHTISSCKIREKESRSSPSSPIRSICTAILGTRLFSFHGVWYEEKTEMTLLWKLHSHAMDTYRCPDSVSREQITILMKKGCRKTVDDDLLTFPFQAPEPSSVSFSCFLFIIPRLSPSVSTTETILHDAPVLNKWNTRRKPHLMIFPFTHFSWYASSKILNN